MAKIKFGDYLKSKERREAVYESDDSIAKRARALIDSDACGVKPQFRIDSYKKAIDLLEQIPDHPDAEKMLQECREGLQSAQAAKLETDFANGKYHLQTADTEHEFRKASEELEAVSQELRQWRDTAGGDSVSDADTKASASVEPCADSGSDEEKESHGRKEERRYEASDYDAMLQEAETLKAQADQQIVRYARSTTRRRGITLVVLFLIAAAAVYVWLSGYYKYLAAKAEGMAGIYESAYSRFYKLGDYLDSRSQYEYYKGKYLKQREAEESQTLPEAEMGDTVTFSSFSWQVLEKEGTKLTLICKSPDAGSAFREVSYDGAQQELREEMGIEPESETSQKQSEENTDSASDSGSGSATWASSSLREYLNETVLEHEFTPAEIAAIQPQTQNPTSNETYGTGSDETTEDRISILSLEQAQSLMEQGTFTKPSVDMWLRTPGHDMHTAAYLTSSGTVIHYGNDVTDDSLSVCPLIVVDYEKLGSE